MKQIKSSQQILNSHERLQKFHSIIGGPADFEVQSPSNNIQSSKMNIIEMPRTQLLFNTACFVLESSEGLF